MYGMMFLLFLILILFFLVIVAVLITGVIGRTDERRQHSAQEEQSHYLPQTHYGSSSESYIDPMTKSVFWRRCQTRNLAKAHKPCRILPRDITIIAIITIIATTRLTIRGKVGRHIPTATTLLVTTLLVTTLLQHTQV